MFVPSNKRYLKFTFECCNHKWDNYSAAITPSCRKHLIFQLLADGACFTELLFAVRVVSIQSSEEFLSEASAQQAGGVSALRRDECHGACALLSPPQGSPTELPALRISAGDGGVRNSLWCPEGGNGN